MRSCAETHYSFPCVTVEDLRKCDESMQAIYDAHPGRGTFNPRRHKTLCGLTVTRFDIVESGAECAECSARLDAHVKDEYEIEREAYEMSREHEFAEARAREFLPHQWEEWN